MASMSQQNFHRASFANRISGIFDRRRVRPHDTDSARATTTFEVPLFLSPARYEPPQARYVDHHDEDTRSRSSVRSLAEAAPSLVDWVPPLTLPASSRYSSRSASPDLSRPPLLPFHEPSLLSSVQSSESNTTRSRTVKGAPRHRRRRRRSSTKVKLQALTRLSAAFGVTLLVTLITYLVLAVTGTAVGIMFHVLMILLILSLTGVFVHCAIRLFVLSKSGKNRRTERRHVDRWHGHERQLNEPFFGEIRPDSAEHHEELLPEKPIRVIMVEDEEAAIDHNFEAPAVKPPPPVYGNFRSSTRINPNLVHWQQIPPSPLTPTYDEAMSDVHHVVGYRPPSYIESDSGVTHVVEQGTQDVDHALNNIHPLERARMTELGHNVF